MKGVGTILFHLAVPHMSVGHFIPSNTKWRNFFRDYLRNPLEDLPSPGPVSNSTTATPTMPVDDL